VHHVQAPACGVRFESGAVFVLLPANVREQGELIGSGVE
jgi:hypothetical protein